MHTVCVAVEYALHSRRQVLSTDGGLKSSRLRRCSVLTSHFCYRVWSHLVCTTRAHTNAQQHVNQPLLRLKYLRASDTALSVSLSKPLNLSVVCVGFIVVHDSTFSLCNTISFFIHHFLSLLSFPTLYFSQIPSFRGWKCLELVWEDL